MGLSSFWEFLRVLQNFSKKSFQRAITQKLLYRKLFSLSFSESSRQDLSNKHLLYGFIFIFRFFTFFQNKRYKNRPRKNLWRDIDGDFFFWVPVYVNNTKQPKNLVLQLMTGWTMISPQIRQPKCVVAVLIRKIDLIFYHHFA